MIHIKRKVSVAFRILDAITGKPVHHNYVQLYVNGVKLKTVYKKEGYLIALNLPDQIYEFEIISDVYQSERVVINLCDIHPSDPVIPVILNPGALYPGNVDMTSVNGKFSAGKSSSGYPDILVAYCRSNEKIKIAQEYAEKGSRCVKLYTSGNKELAGRLFMIRGRDGAGDELVRVIYGPDDHELYTFDHELVQTRKRGEVLRSAVKASVDAAGLFKAKIHDMDKEDKEAFIVVSEHGKVLYAKPVLLEQGAVYDAGTLEF